MAAYDFEEANGSRVIDASDQGNHGTIDGAVRTGQGRFGKAPFFDGIDDWITINDATSLDLKAGMTLKAWVHPTESMTGWRTVLIKGTLPEDPSYHLVANSDADGPAAGVFIGDHRDARGGPSLMPDIWVHLAGTYDGRVLRLYLNGGEVAHGAQWGPIATSDGALRIGGNSFSGEFFKGRIDEVRVYNRALTATEINTDMSTPIATSSPPMLLIGYAKKGAVVNSLRQGKAQAFRTIAINSGWVTWLSVYVNSGSSATRLVAGLYSDKNGHPGALLAQGALSPLGKRGWKQVPIPPVFLDAGRRYWIAILARGGILNFRNRRVSATGRSEKNIQRRLASLPRRWKTGFIDDEGPLSAYGAGHR
ncbi:MAG: LamG domain-containing protein [Pyrinomonadaceae bacterium]